VSRGYARTSDTSVFKRGALSTCGQAWLAYGTAGMKDGVVPPGYAGYRFPPAMVLSSKVGLGDLLALGGVVRLRRLAAQAIAGVPVTARQVAKRPALVAR